MISFHTSCFAKKVGAVAQSVEGASSRQEVMGLIPGPCARSLLVGLVSIEI